MHKSIILNNISLYFPNKICFEKFSTQIQPGSHIAIIGNNGSGKSSLLKIIAGKMPASEGEILNNDNIVFGIVPQIIKEYEALSGGQKFNKALSAALSLRPDVLLLDEPTNHLDLKNRKSLMKMLGYYRGTLIVISHDEELLRGSIDFFWHIHNDKIDVFSGKFDDYKNKLFQRRQSLEEKLLDLKKEKKANHQALMKEQQRAKKSKSRGEKFVEQKKWLPAVGDLKQSSAEKASGKSKGAINETKSVINEQLCSLRIPEILKPKFSLSAKDIGSKTILSLSGASAGYAGKIVFQGITLSVSGGEHIAITGDNGAGKSTLLKAILNRPEIIKEGIWDIPAEDEIAYLDQHYSDLDNGKSVIETLAEIVPQKTHEELRTILNDFLFRKSEEVNKKVEFLSGGEKARLSLAKIAVKTPKLLLIDEITNNIDLETKEHITQVLQEYPGAMVIVSHSESFLESLKIKYFYKL